jgi:hypothetical protein
MRAARWLSLVAALYLALAPVNGLVVCHEPDGSANVELANAELRCTGCDDRPLCGHDADHVPACAELRECPCVDVPLTPDHDSSSVPPAKHVASAPLVAIAPSPFEPFVPRIDAFLGRCELRQPRPPPGFLHLRSVVLVV